jgi:hypothetical protein
MVSAVASIPIDGIIRSLPPFGRMAGIMPRRPRKPMTVASDKCKGALFLDESF